jgi:magnesium chelatase family protein
VLVKIASAALFGIEAYPVEVEVDISLGFPNFVTVGLPDAAVRESKERVRAALKNCGYDLESRRVTINLAPADRKKEGRPSTCPSPWDSWPTWRSSPPRLSAVTSSPASWPSTAA